MGVSPQPRGATNDINRMSWASRAASFSDGRSWQLARFSLFGLAIFVVLGWLLFLTWQSETLTLRAGQIADRTVKAPATATFVSERRTQERRQEAFDDARNVVMVADPNIAPSQVAMLREALVKIDEVRASGVSESMAADRVRSAVEGLSEGDALAIVNLSPEAWSRVRLESQRLLNEVMLGEIRSEDVAAVKERLFERSNTSLSPAERTLATALARPFVRANIEVDEAATQAARQAAAAAVEPVLVTVQAGQVIVRDGDPVNAYDIEKLEHFGLLSPSESWQQFAGTLGLAGLITLGFVFYLFKFAGDLWQGRQLLLVGVVTLVPVVVGRLVLIDPDLRYMFPAAAAVMLIAILLDFQVAVVSGGFLALYLGLVAGMSFEVVFVAFLTAIAGAAVIWRADRTITFVWAGIAVAAAAFALSVLFTLRAGEFEPMRMGGLLFAAAVNGTLSASLTFLFFSLLGRLFGITTHLQLLELAHPNQPLLYRLAREAPGTYHHSIVVSNLAESAVEIVGGDPLFTRVAVLYHDVGKVLRPSFFVENQANRANVHDALDPRTSARIIQEHVSDGVRLAKKAGLPKPIIDVIEQHHGTTLIKYFYTQALNNGEDVDEADFRYPGPKPQTKEAGIILLADSVEATVRAAAQSGKLFEDAAPANGGGSRRITNKLESIVDSVIRARLEDGQLDECDLTLRQIELIRQAFIAVLEGIYHPRIEYPDVTPPAPPSPPAETGARAPAAEAVEVAS